MNAVMLAAGVGSRMGNLDKHKSLLELDGTSILEHKIIALRDLNVDNICIVVGYNKESFRDIDYTARDYTTELMRSKKYDNVFYVFNDRYSSLGTVHSLIKGLVALGSDDYCIGIDGDLMLNYRVYYDLRKENQYFIDIHSDYSDKEIGVVIDPFNYIVKMEKGVGYGRLLGLCTYSPDLIHDMITHYDPDIHYEVRDLLNPLLPKHKVNPVFIENKDYYVEVDLPEDYARAVAIFNNPELELDDTLKVEELESMYRCSPEDTGWLHRNKRNRDRNNIILNTCKWSLIRINGRIASIVRGFSDGAYNVAPEDWITRPEYRGLGYGHKVYHNLIKKFEEEHPIKILTIAEPGRERPHERLGYRKTRGTAMEIRYDYDRFSPHWRGRDKES